jgi:hypothetical protein
MKVDLQFQGLALLLIFIAPGFLFSRSYAAFRPRYHRSPDVFEQMVLSVVASTLIHALFVGILAVGEFIYWTYWRLKGWSPLLKDALSTPLEDYPLSHITGYALLATIYVLFGLTLAYRTGAFLGRLSAEQVPRWLGRILGPRPPEGILLWHTVLQEEPIKQGIFPPRLNIRLRSGENFEGNLVSLRLCGDEANTIELALENVSYTAPITPVIHPSESSRSLQVRRLPGHKVLLRSNDILWLSRVDAPTQKVPG